MVLHNSKWDRKAKRKYLKKHDLKPEDVARGKTNGNMGSSVGLNKTPTPTRKDNNLTHSKSSDSGSEKDTELDNNSDSRVGDALLNEEKKGNGSDSDEGLNGDDRYSRRKPLTSNSWRYAEPEIDPYLERSESEPEPDYAHMKAREFQVPDSLLKNGKHSRTTKHTSEFNDYDSGFEFNDGSSDDEVTDNKNNRGYGKRLDLNEEDLEYQKRTGRLKNNIQVMDDVETFQKLKAKIARAKAANEIKEKFGKSVYDRGIGTVQENKRLDEAGEADIDSFLSEIEQNDPRKNAQFLDDENGDAFLTSVLKSNTEKEQSIKTKVADSEAWLDGLLG
ncbi:hypothetical protein NADFUDRAFT_82488 [Nadsonia fulvescens var. elongata DSM 6958]|uniref:Uncharacterized protein n=1 Tax=Nadsonia fulvescens var. elongata DSM 6958 TaxID=857566 RepID=A0A1E3PN97_9ASCO|nr:hypothetical protein NADFUDRAFT_82488 [Nadsonia fulvescens var. elongata DSM 6958]